MSQEGREAKELKPSDSFLAAAELLEQGVTPLTCLVLLGVVRAYGDRNIDGNIDEFVETIELCADTILAKAATMPRIKTSSVLRAISEDLKAEGR